MSVEEILIADAYNLVDMYQKYIAFKVDKKTEEKIKNGKKQIAYFSTRALDGILESEKGQEQ